MSQVPATQLSYRLDSSRHGFETLTLNKSAPVPQPQRGEVLVRIHAVSLNYRDLVIVKGTYPGSTKPNVIPGSDGAGEIVTLGEGVPDWKVGDRVAATFTPAYIAGDRRYLSRSAGALGGDIDGVLTQYFVAQHTGLVKLPDSLTYEQAAALPCAGVTAYNALYDGINPLRPDHVVLVQGTGGVSILAAQIALAAGARVIATSSSDEKLKRVAELGVAPGDLINYKTTPDWAKLVLELTDGLGVDHVIEVGGIDTIQQSVKSTRVGGEIAVIGFVGGMQGQGLNPLEVLFRTASMRGVHVGSREQFVRLLDHVERGKIAPIVDKVFGKEEAVEAYKYLESGQHFGKIVISLV